VDFWKRGKKGELFALGAMGKKDEGKQRKGKPGPELLAGDKEGKNMSLAWFARVGGKKEGQFRGKTSSRFVPASWAA